MALRCLLFTADEGTADPIRQVLADLGVEGELRSAAVDAVASVTQESFQIVIIDWDMQPEAALLLKTTRERKASERPLTLAVVSDDASVPQALQAGANSILRKPIVANQAKDTLTTARDLLRAKENAASQAVAVAASSSPLPASMSAGSEKTLRIGEFLQAAPTAPGGQFVTDMDAQLSDQTIPEPVDTLKELEPISAAVAEGKSEPVRPESNEPQSNEPRGLQWYLNQRAAPAIPKVPAQSAASSAPPASTAPELLGFDQMESPSVPAPFTEEPARQDTLETRLRSPITSLNQDKEEKRETAHQPAHVIETTDEHEPQPRPPLRLGKAPIMVALTLAACAVVAAPQAPWHARVKVLWGRGQQSLHAWLNPQPVTPAQAPVAHEDFGRAGDEYKLPVAENIPDATTDPSQIRVEPVIDPTAKKPNNAGTNSTDSQTANGTDAAAANPADHSQAPGVQGQKTPAVPAVSGQPPTSNSALGTSPPAAGAPMPGTPATAIVQPHPDAPSTTLPVAPKADSAPPQKTPQIRIVSAAGNPPVPSSLTSQMASMTPEASGNKAPETAMPSIEPVAITEATERGLVLDQPAIAYPTSANGQLGTVVLQVLIGRDGTVQDAKFLQGSLAFARAAIEGVKQWKFKPYVMNGRPVSVVTQMTMSFRPGSQ